MNIKTLAVTVLTVVLSVVSADFMTAQNFHYRKGWEFSEIDWERSAFSEWEDGMQAGEMSSTIMVAACYMREYGVGRNVSKGVSIMENLASKNTDVALFAANFWFPILDDKPFFDYYPHAGGQYNMWSMFKWWQEKDLRATNFGLEANYAKVLKFSKMYLAKVSKGYGANLAKGMIGYCYENGVGGVRKNLTKALEYYSSANSERLYVVAAAIIKDLTSIQEIEDAISPIKHYFSNDVLSALERKPEIEYCYDAKDVFIRTYVSKYKQNSEDQAKIWIEKNNLYSEPDKFIIAFQEESDNFIKDEIKKLVETEFFNKFETSNSSDTLKCLWQVYKSFSNNELTLARAGLIYMEVKCDEIIHQNDNYIDQIICLSALMSDPIFISFSNRILRINGDTYDNSFHYLDRRIDEPRNKLMIPYLIELLQDQPGCWIWNNTIDVPYMYQCTNMLYGSQIRENSRRSFINIKDKICEMYNLVNEKESLSKYCNMQNKFNDFDFVQTFAKEVKGKNYVFTQPFNTKFTDKYDNWYNSRDDLFNLVNSIDDVNRIKLTCEEYMGFIDILLKEDSKTIIPEDYSSYLEKYPDAYYKQYCIDGYAMAKADTFTLDTPKDEIKKLLDSGITKGAAKYVKMVTKKSYLKSKSL